MGSCIFRPSQCMYHMKATRPRASKYERLLKAILKAYDVHSDVGTKELLDKNLFGIQGITDKQEQELIAIKERMK